jgi:hypothetical protein
MKMQDKPMKPMSAVMVDGLDLPNGADYPPQAGVRFGMCERYNSATPGVAPSRLAALLGPALNAAGTQTAAHLELRRFVDHVPLLARSAGPNGAFYFINQDFEITWVSLRTVATDPMRASHDASQ